MSTFDAHWLESYVRALEVDADFTEAARWFDGRVAYRCGEGDAVWLDIHRSKVTASGLGAISDATFTLAGEAEGWRELLSPETVNGTINRLYRQGKIRVMGDMVKVMLFWKMVFWMTEVADRIPLPSRA